MSMSAKELLKFIGPVESGSKWEFCAEHQATILRALSLLAAVEDGDEIVRYLNKDAARLLAKSKQVPSTAGQMKYEEISRKQANAAARITQDAQEIAALKGELEDERIRLAACGVVAMANTPESAAKMRQMKDKYRSASLSDVERAVDAEMALRAELASVKAHAEAMADRYREFNECAADDTEMSLQRLHDAVDAYRAHKEGA